MLPCTQVKTTLHKNTPRRKPCCRKPSPPFRAEQIGSLLRPKALLEQRAKFARGEIDQADADQGRGRRDQGRARAAGARRIEIRDRRRIPPPLLSQLLLPPARRPQHRHRRRRGGQGRQCRDARRPAGRDDQQPRALDASDQRAGLRVHPRQHRPRSEDHHSRPLRAALPRRRRRRAGGRLQGRRPVLGRHGRGVRPGAGRAGRGRLPLRADRRDGVRQVRRSRGAAVAQGARRRLERADRQIHRRHQPRARERAGRACGSACICAAATAAASGTPRAATTTSPTGCSTRSTSRSTSSNTIRRAPARSRRCGWCRATRPWCSASSRPRRRRWRARTR